MAEIKNIDGKEIIDYMSRDYDSFLQSMKSLIPQKLPEWTDYNSEADFGNVLLQLFAHMGDILSYYQDRIANESYLGTAQTRRSIIHHLRLIGYKLSTAAPASTQLTISFTIPANRNQVITINRGGAFATKSQSNKPSVRFEYNQETPFIIDLKKLPEDQKIYTCEIPVEEGRLVKDETLGVSGNTPNQRFPLAHSPLILRSLGQDINKDIVLITKSGDSIENWQLQESLAFSIEGQNDFTIDIDENDRAVIVFGDGAFGRIPPGGAVIKATYRVGGGINGNVPRDTIKTIVNAPQLAAVAANVMNPQPATGGAERESIEHAVFHAPSVFRSMKRAVTREDYEALARNFKGVGKVRAEASNWNTVNLFVAPAGGGQVSDLFKANLLAYFEDLRPVSTRIEIMNVDYVKIYITAEIGIGRYYDVEDVKAKTRSAVADLLAFDNVDFAVTVYLSKFYEAIEEIKGVEFVNITEFKAEGKPPNQGLPPENFESSGKLQMESYEIPRIPDDSGDDPAYAGGIKLLVEGEL